MNLVDPREEEGLVILLAAAAAVASDFLVDGNIFTTTFYSYCSFYL
jgi:hypothetical protein